MSLVKLSYSEFENEPRHWKISDATFSNINLIVGKNSSGKSRLIAVINSLARLLSGQHMPFEACKFLAIIKLNNREFAYEIDFKGGAVSREILKIDGEEKLSRGENGSGKIRYEKEGRDLDFKLPSDVVAAVNRRDEIQHPFLMELHQWANSVVLYLFGSDFGKSQLMGITDAQAFFSNPNPPVFDDPSNLVGVYSSAFTRFGENFDKAIIADMNTLGYSLTHVGSENLQSIIKFPLAALGMFTVESDLGFQNPQMHMSQGMFRAFALVVHLNLCAFSKNKQLILVDDIGEGLDYERAVAIIDLLINKAQEKDMQLIMTSNDRFVMNKVPLEYWSVMKRKSGIVKMFNLRNSQKQFDQFKYLGLNNFDFFALDFFEAEVAND
jgi:energy-coupling factor transporter ATP-binding protein EcfA2